MELQVIGGSQKKIKVSELAFGCDFNEGLAHQAVVAYLAAGRQGTKAQKNRSAVSGGGKKPWKQKGSGRARAGTIRSPLWRGGGTTFAAEPRDHSQKLNKKMYKQALSVILSELVRQDRLKVIEKLELSAPKTKELVNKLNELEMKKVLIVIDQEDSNLSLAARNLHGVVICEAAHINPVDLASHEHVLFTVEALKKVEGRLS